MINHQDDGMTLRIKGNFRLLYSSHVRWALLATLLLAGVSTAKADGLDNFLLTDGTQTMTWTLPSSPTPSIFTPNFFSMNGVTILENGSPTTANITFYNNPAADGGVSACNSSPACSDLGFFNFYDFQTFSGTTAAPTFIPGTYTDPATEDDAGFFAGCTAAEQDAGCGIGDTWALSPGNNDVNLTLTITQAITHVPEPSSLILLGSGLVGLMGMGLRRKRLI